MSNRSFEVRVLEQYCKGCGLCVEVCSQGKLYMSRRPNERGIQPALVKGDTLCTGCLQCATVCPDAAIEIRRLDTPEAAKESDKES